MFYFRYFGVQQNYFKNRGCKTQPTNNRFVKKAIQYYYLFVKHDYIAQGERSIQFEISYHKKIRILMIFQDEPSLITMHSEGNKNYQGFAKLMSLERKITNLTVTNVNHPRQRNN